MHANLQVSSLWYIQTKPSESSDASNVSCARQFVQPSHSAILGDIHLKPTIVVPRHLPLVSINACAHTMSAMEHQVFVVLTLHTPAKVVNKTFCSVPQARCCCAGQQINSPKSYSWRYEKPPALPSAQQRSPSPPWPQILEAQPGQPERPWRDVWGTVCWELQHHVMVLHLYCLLILFISSAATAQEVLHELKFQKIWNWTYM